MTIRVNWDFGDISTFFKSSRTLPFPHKSKLFNGRHPASYSIMIPVKKSRYARVFLMQIHHRLSGRKIFSARKMGLQHRLIGPLSQSPGALPIQGSDIHHDHLSGQYLRVSCKGGFSIPELSNMLDKCHGRFRLFQLYQQKNSMWCLIMWIHELNAKPDEEDSISISTSISLHLSLLSIFISQIYIHKAFRPLIYQI